jgi:(S)-mandelate dehydrogenase
VDILKARALGAQAVLVGRATLFGVMAAGEPGARRALEILSTEFERAMKLCGVRTIAEIGPELLCGYLENART